MRFGGLTAVANVDFSVEKGHIFSIIGPNGAGKTTVFNAITGLYEPTEGSVRFRGCDPRRSFRTRVAIGILLIALGASVALAILSTNIDSLWRTVVVLNYPDASEPFPRRKAWDDFRTFLRAGVMTECEPNKLTDIVAERVKGTWVVQEGRKKVVLERCDDEEVANQRKDVVESMVHLAGSLRTTIRGNGQWLVVTSVRYRIGLHDTEEKARGQAQDLQDLRRAAPVNEAGVFSLRVDGRTLKTFRTLLEAVRYRDQMAFAAHPLVEAGEEGRWQVATCVRHYLGMHATEEEARRQTDYLRDLARAQLAENGDRWILRTDGKTLATFSNRFEAEQHQSEFAFAAQSTVEKAGGRWIVLGPGRQTVLDVFESREAAKARLMEIAVLAGKLKWRIVTRSSTETLGFASTPEDVSEKIRATEELLSLGTAAPLEERDGRVQVLSADRARVLASFDTRSDAEERVRFFASVARAQTRDRAFLWIFAFGGLALGGGGAFLYWKRTRGTPDVISLCGMARTFQNIRLFHDMTVLENLLVAMDRSFRAGILPMMFRTSGIRLQEKSAAQRGVELLRFVGLEDRAFSLAKNLPYGNQRRLEIARALATDPTLILLDEPAAGMNPAETAELMRLIRRIRDRGITVLLIEHHMKLVMGISDRIAVLDHGIKIAEGRPEEIRADPKVIEAYLGKEEVG